MPTNRKLWTDGDFQEAIDRHLPVRIFENDQLVGSGGCIIRFDDTTVVIQSGVDDLAYHDRDRCEFFELRR
ncbi:hypothetical protein [Paenibacillus medicaginis]|uniref:Uncharacterized protein n=1 Tax=Paenibacillus medicaginis TaxID=1470560 RepID=A0ABV5C8U5_9BACL